jgi:uncharacterized membrane protein YgcG
MLSLLKLGNKWCCLHTVFVCIVLLSSSCRKEEYSLQEIDKQAEGQFFALPVNATPELQMMVEDIKRQNQQYNFIPDFARNNGYPVWDEVISSAGSSIIQSSELLLEQAPNSATESADVSMTFIPLKPVSGPIKTYIVCLKKNGKYKYKVYRRQILQNSFPATGNQRKFTEAAISIFGLFEKLIHSKDTINVGGYYPDVIKEVSLVFRSSQQGLSSVREQDILGTSTAGGTTGFITTVCYRIPCASSQKGKYDENSSDIFSVFAHPSKVCTICFDQADMGWIDNGIGGGGSGGGGGGSIGGGGSGGSSGCLTTEWWCEAGLINGQVIDRLISLGNLTGTQQSWLVYNSIIANELYAILEEQGYFSQTFDGQELAETQTALNVTIELLRRNLAASPFNESVKSVLDAYLDPALTQSPEFDPTYWHMISMQMAFLKFEHPEWSQLRCFWEANKLMVHISLDITGLVPGFGEVADVVNGVIYTIEGNGIDATLSYSSAIPLAGWGTTGAKIARYTVKFTDNSTTVLNYIRKGNGFVDFGKKNSAQFRKILGLAVGDARQAHHLIPWEIADDAVVQAAALSKEAFHMQKALNGIPLSTIQHMGSHPNYTERVRLALLEINRKFNNNISPTDASLEIEILINKIKTAITDNPNTRIDDIIF